MIFSIVFSCQACLELLDRFRFAIHGALFPELAPECSRFKRNRWRPFNITAIDTLALEPIIPTTLFEEWSAPPWELENVDSPITVLFGSHREPCVVVSQGVVDQEGGIEVYVRQMRDNDARVEFVAPLFDFPALVVKGNLLALLLPGFKFHLAPTRAR